MELPKLSPRARIIDFIRPLSYELPEGKKKISSLISITHPLLTTHTSISTNSPLLQFHRPLLLTADHTLNPKLIRKTTQQCPFFALYSGYRAPSQSRVPFRTRLQIVPRRSPLSAGWVMHQSFCRRRMAQISSAIRLRPAMVVRTMQGPVGLEWHILQMSKMRG